MPELYPGQTEVVAGNLEQLELLQRADEERLKGAEKPEARATILDRMAGRVSQMSSIRRQLQGLETGPENRSLVLRVRVTPTEHARISEAASAAGQTLAQYLRGRFAG